MKRLALSILVTFTMISCKTNQQEIVSGQTKTQSVKRPNIIFIMADDHATQAISAYGHPISQLAPTPNIDRIANDGAIFRNNFCTNSICGPSRAVVLTGKHNHINGFRMNGDTFDGDQPTFPKMLQKAGYKTAMIGKWHLNGHPQGFDSWNILTDQGNYYNPDFITQNAQNRRIDTTRINGYATDIITNEALRYLNSVKDMNQPFMMMLHHKAPHRNWMPALRHLNSYDDIEFPLPETYFTDHQGSTASKEQQQTIYTDMYEGHDLKMTVAKGSSELAHNPWKTDFERMTPLQRTTWNLAYQKKNDAMHDANMNARELAVWKGQRYLHEYLATIKAVDEGVGKILDFLDANGLSENTLIIYTTDQGFYLGEKGWFDKRFMYEESLAMPMVAKFPGVIKKGTQITALTQNLDFAETFLDFAGVEIPDDMQGKSLRPLLEGSGGPDEFRDAIYYHYYDFPAFHMVKKMYGIRTERYKLIHVYDDIDEWELYDLQTDPQEIHNLIADSRYDEIEQNLLIRLKQLQSEYSVTDKEFEQADKLSIERNYKNFDRLRGKPSNIYQHNN